jgi:DNA-binding NtrC family response regulator
MATDLTPETQRQVGPAETADEHEPTVLVVDDDEDTRFAMSQVLAQEGYLVLTAATGHDAVATLREPLSRIDVVLLDVHLPDVSGTELCARLRELYPDLPVLVCTGEADSEEVAELVRLGAIRYFRKPMAVDELLSTVEAALS